MMIDDYNNIALADSPLPPVESSSNVNANHFNAALVEAQQISPTETAVKRPQALALPGDEVRDRKTDFANTYELLQKLQIHEKFDLMLNAKKQIP